MEMQKIGKVREFEMKFNFVDDETDTHYHCVGNVYITKAIDDNGKSYTHDEIYDIISKGGCIDEKHR